MVPDNSRAEPRCRHQTERSDARRVRLRVVGFCLAAVGFGRCNLIGLIGIIGFVSAAPSPTGKEHIHTPISNQLGVNRLTFAVTVSRTGSREAWGQICYGRQAGLVRPSNSSDTQRPGIQALVTKQLGTRECEVEGKGKGPAGRGHQRMIGMRGMGTGTGTGMDHRAMCNAKGSAVCPYFANRAWLGRTHLRRLSSIHQAVRVRAHCAETATCATLEELHTAHSTTDINYGVKA